MDATIVTPPERRCSVCGKRLTIRQGKVCSRRCGWAQNHDLAQCGTAAAIRRHYRRQEPLDVVCRAAQRRVNAERRTRAGAR